MHPVHLGQRQRAAEPPLASEMAQGGDGGRHGPGRDGAIVVMYTIRGGVARQSKKEMRTYNIHSISPGQVHGSTPGDSQRVEDVAIIDTGLARNPQPGMSQKGGMRTFMHLILHDVTC